jgi:hypothetical protein
VLVDVLEAVWTPQPRFAVLLELAFARQQLLLLDAAAADFDLDFLAVALLQFGLIVPRVHRRRAAVHEQENHPLGFRRKMRRANRQRIGSGKLRQLRGRLGSEAVPGKESVLVEQGRERQAREAGARLPEEFAALAGAETRFRIHDSSSLAGTKPGSGTWSAAPRQDSACLSGMHREQVCSRLKA